MPAYPHRMRLSHTPEVHAIRMTSDHPEAPIKTACGPYVGFTGDERLPDDTAVTCEECNRGAADTGNVRLRAEATVNGRQYTVTTDAPRSMWDDSLTDLRPDLGRERVVAALRERLALEIAKHLDVTVSEETPAADHA